MSFDLSGSVVLDSSVVIKWFRRHEVLQEQAFLLRRAYLDGHLLIYVPDLLIYEVANVLRYKPDMDQIGVQRALQSLFDMGIGIKEINPGRIRRTVAIAHSCNVTVYDAVYVALMEQLEASFVTADEKLIQNLNGIPYVYRLADIT